MALLIVMAEMCLGAYDVVGSRVSALDIESSQQPSEVGIGFYSIL